ncbi:hypothetical protein SSE37_00240 [Sagittula stellata E-37]|uniref:Uncharacterized protein n=1 Tax=Sagittula stellata (strain ATCC 700073 / DSM 11524 / E-37) TaxID=388399 RepID=A3K794_SAGS3|nr:hypothetical protein SSE37_00240 [Sagittula stellata E-37]
MLRPFARRAAAMVFMHAGTPAWTEVSSTISGISSRLTPVFIAARI